MIDVALYEAVFNCMESLLPEYSAFGAVRGPAGSALPGIAPSNAYRCSDGGYALIAGNGDSIFKRLMAAIGRDDLARRPGAGRQRRPRGARGRDRRGHRRSGPRSAPWTRCWRRWTAPPCRPAASTPWPTSPPTRTTGARHAGARCAWTTAAVLAVPGIVPKLSRTPGGHRRNAPALGQDTDAVLREMGLSPEQISTLKDQGIVAGGTP